MMKALRETGKRSAGWLLSRTSGRYSFRNCIFILAHMRCGSTALSNVLCSRRDVSGYGEVHIRYDGEAALGRLALNQMRRDAWKPDAACLFDKILHSQYDGSAPPDFFQARAVFIVRRPAEAIRSIVDLFVRLERRAYDTPHKAAVYYAERVETLAALWQRFPADRRIGVTHEGLLRDPDRALSRISGHLRFEPALANRYVSLPASRRAGGGDPLVSGHLCRIEPGRPAIIDDHELELPRALRDRVHAAHASMLHLIDTQVPNLNYLYHTTKLVQFGY